MKETQKIREIFNRIDKAINEGLSKGLCINFLKDYEFIKRGYLE